MKLDEATRKADDEMLDKIRSDDPPPRLSDSRAEGLRTEEEFEQAAQRDVHTEHMQNDVMYAAQHEITQEEREGREEGGAAMTGSGEIPGDYDIQTSYDEETRNTMQSAYDDARKAANRAFSDIEVAKNEVLDDDALRNNDLKRHEVLRACGIAHACIKQEFEMCYDAIIKHDFRVAYECIDEIKQIVFDFRCEASAYRQHARKAEQYRLVEFEKHEEAEREKRDTVNGVIAERRELDARFAAEREEQKLNKRCSSSEHLLETHTAKGETLWNR